MGLPFSGTSRAGFTCSGCDVCSRRVEGYIPHRYLARCERRNGAPGGSRTHRRVIESVVKPETCIIASDCSQLRHDGKCSWTIGSLRRGILRCDPVVPDLQSVLDDATPYKHLTILTTAYGQPFTAAGFGGWFRERCDERLTCPRDVPPTGYGRPPVGVWPRLVVRPARSPPSADTKPCGRFSDTSRPPIRRGLRVLGWKRCAMPSPGPKPHQTVATPDDELPKICASSLKTQESKMSLAGVEGLEPPTPGFGDRCSSH